MPLDGTYRIYIIPNHFTENDVVMKVESNISKKDNGLVHNFFVRAGYMNSHNAFVQYEVDEGVSISSKTQTPAKIRELAANYMYAAGYRAGAVLEGATSQNNRKTVYPMYDYANQCHAASIEWQHGALIVRGEAPIDYHILSEYAKYRSGQIEIEDERNNALNKIAEKITQSNPSYIYGIIDNVIVECNKNQIVGHMLGCPQYTFTASFENKSDARDVLETVTQHLESQMKAYANESPDIIKQNETDDLEYNDDFEEVI
jgi:hypothetical protein